MKTFNRICIKDYQRIDSIGQVFNVKRGKEYLTSSEEDGEVTVFSNFWVKVPVNIFAGEEKFT